MTEYYYSTQPFLAWCLNHHFYGASHYVWVANPFYPYRAHNPKSSNPFLIYQDLYQPWVDRDDFDKFIQQARLNLKKGVEGYRNANPGVLSRRRVTRLKRICDRVDIIFFYPIVYRIDTIDSTRRLAAGSGLVGSREYKIPDLQEREFNILFLDFTGDTDVDKLKPGAPPISDTDALRILERRC